MSHGRVESLLRYNYQVPSLGNCMMKLSTEAGLMAIIPRAFGSAEDTHFAICHGFWSLAASNYHQLLFLQVLLILCYNLPRSLLMFVVLPRRLNYVLQPSGHLTVSGCYHGTSQMPAASHAHFEVNTILTNSRSESEG
ncbi:hypothetical protein PVAP13_4KG219503 [Panicum virgatum]|uniref:Uncharacterized protein n=1 Tax=Panicum virgatum TaxID=38727 RepID=A0A8T0TPG3_PANVG|nr:hypothetical protein PVAP13_4KG219503 [Panicum virgatum]